MFRAWRPGEEPEQPSTPAQGALPPEGADSPRKQGPHKAAESTPARVPEGARDRAECEGPPQAKHAKDDASAPAEGGVETSRRDAASHRPKEGRKGSKGSEPADAPRTEKPPSRIAEPSVPDLTATVRMAPASTASPGEEPAEGAEPEPASSLLKPVVPAMPVSEGPAAPVPIVPPAGAGPDGDIKRLTRIIVSDIVIYGPDKAEKAIREGRFADLYKAEIEEGRKMIRSRFPQLPSAVEVFEASLAELLKSRQKELLGAAL